MDNSITKGTIVRTLCLVLALVNQLLSAFGKSPLPIDNVQLEQLITSLITIAAALVNWWENNSFTEEALAGDALYKRLREKKQK